MSKNIIYLSKDVLRRDYIRHYNSKSNFETPNIDKLANEGTVFENYYCSSPSSGMAATCFASGLSAHELDRKTFREVDQFNQVKTIFNEFTNRNYQTYVLWTKEFEHLAYVHSKVFDSSTINHYAPRGGSREITPQKHAFDKVSGNNSSYEEYNLAEYFYEYIKKIENNSDKPWFLWCHCPHVFLPFKSYGSDIQHFDNFVGKIADNIAAEIILSADHGHFNCEKGKLVYGHDVYDPVSRIPLITPNYFGKKIIKHPVEQSQLKDIILDESLEQKEFVYCDTRYYEQPDRVIMIRKDNYKYIYNKIDDSEELYDLDFDASENVNLLVDKWPCFDRRASYSLDEIVYYKNWDLAEKYYNLLSEEKKRIWKQGSFGKSFLHKFFGNRARNMGWQTKFKKNLLHVPGRWECQRARIRSI